VTRTAGRDALCGDAAAVDCLTEGKVFLCSDIRDDGHLAVVGSQIKDVLVAQVGGLTCPARFG